MSKEEFIFEEIPDKEWKEHDCFNKEAIRNTKELIKRCEEISTKEYEAEGFTTGFRNNEIRELLGLPLLYL